MGGQTTTPLGALIDRDLNFDKYVLWLCRKADKKLSILIRISQFMTFPQRRNIGKLLSWKYKNTFLYFYAFIESQFGYCPLVSMFCGREANASISHIHKRRLREVYNNEVSPFEQLLPKDRSGTIHERNIKTLFAKLFKIKKNTSRIYEYIK